MEEEFSVRVRAGPPPAARLLPSERRYSASTALGLALVHLALALLAALLLAALWRPAPAPALAPTLFRAHPSAHESTAVLAAAAALVVAALLPGAAGLLAWHRWYEDRNIRWLLVAAVVSAAGALASLATTSAALASAHERWDLHRLSGSGILLAERPPARSPPAGARRGSTPPATPALPTMPALPAMPAEPAEQPLNATWPESDHAAAAAAAAAGGNETLASPEHESAYEAVTGARNGSPAPTESDSSPHVFLFPGVHSPVDPEDENGTFQNIWKHLSGEVGLVHPPNTEPKSETDERVGTTTVEGTDTRFDASEYAHEHRPPQEEPHDFPPTESYYHSDDYEMEADGSFPDWQHDVRIVPTNIPPSHVGYSADREHSDEEEHAKDEHTDREEHAIEGDETSPPDHEPKLHHEENLPDIPYGHISHKVPHEQISPHVLHEKTTYDHPREEIPHDDLHEEISPDAPHEEISPDAPHEETSPQGSSAGPAHERRRRADGEYADDPADAHDFPSASRFWDPRATMSFVLSLNLIVAAVAEFAWSLWTLLFAWRGARSGYPGDEERRSAPVTPQPLAAAATTANAHAPPVPKHGPAAHAHAHAHAQAHASHLHKLRRPDIISNHQQKDPILQETTMPYQERVRRFLASEAPASAETQIE